MHRTAQQDLRAHLRSLIGEGGFAKLCEEFAGTSLYVPKMPRQGHALVELVGIDAAKRLADEFGGMPIRIPLARADRARHYRAQGMSIAKLARKLGITESGVGKLLKRLGD